MITFVSSEVSYSVILLLAVYASLLAFASHIPFFSSTSSPPLSQPPVLGVHAFSSLAPMQLEVYDV